MSPKVITHEESTKHLIEGLKWLIQNLEDGLIECNHWEHYSEQGPDFTNDYKWYASIKHFNLHIVYTKVDVNEGNKN